MSGRFSFQSIVEDIVLCVPELWDGIDLHRPQSTSRASRLDHERAGTALTSGSGKLVRSGALEAR
jgi:hypothetical protein